MCILKKIRSNKSSDGIMTTLTDDDDLIRFEKTAKEDLNDINNYVDIFYNGKIERILQVQYKNKKINLFEGIIKVKNGSNETETSIFIQEIPAKIDLLDNKNKQNLVKMLELEDCRDNNNGLLKIFGIYINNKNKNEIIASNNEAMFFLAENKNYIIYQKVLLDNYSEKLKIVYFNINQTTKKQLEIANKIVHCFDMLHKNDIIVEQFSLANVLITREDSGKVEVVFSPFFFILNLLNKDESEMDHNKTNKLSLLNYINTFGPPEIKKTSKYNKQTDIWLLGLMLLQIFDPNNITATSNYTGNQSEHVQTLIEKQKLFSKPDSLDKETYEKIKACLEIDPAKRISTSELKSYFLKRLEQY